MKIVNDSAFLACNFFTAKHYWSRMNEFSSLRAKLNEGGWGIGIFGFAGLANVWFGFFGFRTWKLRFFGFGVFTVCGFSRI